MSLVIRGAIVSLCAFYLYVAHATIHPKVSDAYRDYYILRSTDLTVAERKRLPPLQAGREHDHKDAAIGFDKWSGPEETFRWNDGKPAKLTFKLTRKRWYGRPDSLP